MNLRSYPLSFVRRSVWLSAQRLGGRLSLRLAGVKPSGVLYPPSFGPAGGSSPIISQGTPIRATCALTSSGAADVSEFRHRILMQRPASPFVISNAVRGTWLALVPHPREGQIAESGVG